MYNTQKTRNTRKLQQYNNKASDIQYNNIICIVYVIIIIIIMCAFHYLLYVVPQIILVNANRNSGLKTV